MDTGYSSDERRYTIITVDNSDVESLGRSLTLPVLRAVLSDGSRIKRGIMNRLDYVVLNEGAGRVENIRLKVKVGSHDHISEPFDLDPGTSRTIPVVVGGYDDLTQGLAALTTIIQVTPRANEVVQIIRSGRIEVEGKEVAVGSLSSYYKALQIANLLADEIRRGDFRLAEPITPLPKDTKMKPLVARKKQS